MRFIAGKLDEVPAVPDSVCTFLLAANTAQAADYPSGADYCRIVFATTAGAAHSGVFNGNSTGALWASTHTATAGSTTADSLIAAGNSQMYARPRASTGYSVIAPTSGVCHVEFWSRAGTT